MIKTILKNSFNLNRENQNVGVILWVVLFCYSICAALIFQKLLLPLIPSLHATGGLLPNDPAYFDSVAKAMAEKIHLYGWGSWQLYPTFASSGNVAIVGALYAIFGYDPAIIVPVNAAIHAFGGVLVYLLACEISNQASFGIYAGVIAATLFTIFPSALGWYGQNLKDGYSIAGLLLVLLTWVKAVRGHIDIPDWLLLALGNFAGILLIASARPYSLKMLLAAALGVWLAVIGAAIYRRQIGYFIRLGTFFLVVIITLTGAVKVLSNSNVESGAQLGDGYANWQGKNEWQWEDAPWLPNNVEHYIETVARTRAGLIEYGLSIKAGSMVDADITPHNVVEVIAYLPRALQIASLAPFPATWLDSFSITRLVSVGEMAVYYLCVPGIFLLLLYNRKPSVLIAIYFACFFLVAHGVTLANMGTLYRVRYPYLFVLLMLGVLGWFTWLDKTGRLKRLVHLLQPPAIPITSQKAKAIDPQPDRKEVFSSGFVVMGLTLLCFIGFFLRDIIMAQKFGLGASLDNFFIALLVPMFIVTVVCMPLGTAFVPVYLGAKEQSEPQAVKALVSSISSWTMLGSLVISLLLYLLGPTLLPFLYLKGSFPDMQQLIPLLNLALPILLFSGVVILGNSVLNAHGRAVLTSSAQLIVPVAAIAALWFFGDGYGVKAVMFGMVVGQILNLLIVQYYLKRYDVSLLPQPDLRNQAELSPLLLQYLPLVGSAFFAAVAAPVATLLAISLPEGGVSAFNLGNKVVLVATGLVSAAISTVMLPYFSALIAKNHLVSVRRELSFFLLFATFVSVPVSAGLFIWSEPIIRLMFEGGTFDSNATRLVARVMQYTVVQLPFFVCNFLLLKFATATKHVFAICVVAIIGLLVNIGASILLMERMDVAGIAMGASVSMLLSTVLLVLVLVRYWHITKFDALIMLLNWLLFVTLLICLHFRSVPSAYVTVLAYVVLLAGYFNSLISDKLSGVRLQN